MIAWILVGIVFAAIHKVAIQSQENRRKERESGDRLLLTAPRIGLWPITLINWLFPNFWGKK